MTPPPPRPTLFPYTTLFRSRWDRRRRASFGEVWEPTAPLRFRRRGSRRPPTLSDLYKSCQETSEDRKSTRLNSSHSQISYAVFCLKKKTRNRHLPLSFHTRD